MSKNTRKKLLIMLLTMTGASALTFGMAACGTEEEEGSHNFSEDWSKDGSNHWHACIDDGCTEAQGSEQHKFGAPKQTKAPTCYSLGEQTLTCTVCGYEKTEPVAMVQHAWSEAWSTNEEQHYHVCTNAGCTANTAEADHGAWKDAGIVTDETCTEDGVKNVECEVCGYTVTAPIPATGHTPGDYSVVVKTPTCVKEGEEVTNCKTCGEEYSIIIPFVGHSAGEITVVTPPTCTEDGLNTSTCTECGADYEIVVPALGHDWGQWNTVGENQKCTEEGLRRRECLNDGCSEFEEEVVPATEHRYGDWVTHDATCTENGSREHTCVVCGDEETEVIPATGHKYTKWFITEYPTETTTGTATKYCQGDSAHNVVVELPKLSATQSGYIYDSVTGLYDCTVNHTLGDITFKTYNIENIDDAVRVAMETQLQVISSEAHRANTMITEKGAMSSSSIITYELGTNYAHIVDESENREYFYSLNDDGSLFPVMKSYIGGTKPDDPAGYQPYTDILISKDVTATRDSLNGYGYGFTFMTNGLTYNGLGTFINYLYTVGKTNVNKDFVSGVKTVDGKEVYYFSYGCLAGKYFDVVSVEFSFDDNFIVSNAQLNVKTYTINESAANPIIELSDPHLSVDADGKYYYDGKLLIYVANMTDDPNDTWEFPEDLGGYIMADAFIDSDGTPKMRVQYTAYFEQLTNGTYRVIPGMEGMWANSETYTVTQTSVLEEGKELPTNPYNYEDFVISSFDLEYGGQTLEEGRELEVSANSSIQLLVKNVLPSTYNPYFDDFSVYLVDEEGNRIDATEINGLKDGEIGYHFYSGNTGVEVTKNYSITIKSLLAGEWDLYVVTLNKEFKLHLKVDYIGADPLYVEVQEYNDLTEKTSWNRTLTSTSVYQGQEVVLRGVVEHPAYENGKYTVTVIKDGFDVTSSCVQLTPVDGLAVYTFSAEETGTYYVTLNPELGTANSLTVKVKDAPDVTSMLVGEFGNTEKGYQVTLNPAEEGALYGTATIVKGFDDNTETTTISYSYDADAHAFTCTYVSGAQGDFVQGVELPYNYGLELSKSYKLYLTYESGFNGERVKVLIGGFENALVCEGSIILAKDMDHAPKLVANVSGIYKITSSNSNTFISINGGDPVLVSGMEDVTLYIGDTVKIWNGISEGASYSIELVEALQIVYVEGLEFENAAADVREGATLALEPIFTPVHTTQRGLVWTSSDEDVATVDASGIVTGVKAGSATITATTTNGKYSATVEITVIGANLLKVGENVIAFTGPFWDTQYTFNGEEGKTYTVKAVTSGAMGGKVDYNGIPNSFPASFEIEGGDVTLSISSYSYGEGSVTVTITEKVEGGIVTNFDPLKVGTTTVNVYPNYIYYTIVGEPNTKYTVTVSDATLYAVENGEVVLGNSANGTFEYTADANGLADICFFPGMGPGEYTINVVGGSGTSTGYTELNADDTVTVENSGYTYYTLVGDANTKYTLTAADLTFYNVVDGNPSTSGFKSGSKTYTTDANGRVDICVYRGGNPAGDYTIVITGYAEPVDENLTAQENADGVIFIAGPGDYGKASGLNYYSIKAVYKIVVPAGESWKVESKDNAFLKIGKAYTYDGTKYNVTSTISKKDDITAGTYYIALLTDTNGSTYAWFTVSKNGEPEPAPVVEEKTVTVGNFVAVEVGKNGVTLNFSGCEEGITYKLVALDAYDNESNKVKFTVGTQQGNPVVFDYSSYVSSSGTISLVGNNSVTVYVLLEEYEEEPQVITVGEEASVSGASFMKPVVFEISLDAASYNIYVNGTKLEYVNGGSDAYIANGPTMYDDSINSDDENVVIGAAGTYYLLCYVDGTVKVEEVEGGSVGNNSLAVGGELTLDVDTWGVAVSLTGCVAGKTYKVTAMQNGETCDTAQIQIFALGSYYNFGEAEFTYAAGVELNVKSAAASDLHNVTLKLEEVGGTVDPGPDDPDDPGDNSLAVNGELTLDVPTDGVTVKLTGCTEGSTYKITANQGGSKSDYVNIQISDLNGDGEIEFTYSDGMEIVLSSTAPIALEDVTVKLQQVGGGTVDPDDPGGNRTFEVPAPTGFGFKNIEIGNLKAGEEVTIVINDCSNGTTYNVFWENAFGMANEGIDIIKDGQGPTNYLTFSADGTVTVVVKSSSGDLSGVKIRVEVGW